MNTDQKVVNVSFAGRGYAHWMTIAGANPREKGIHDAAFGHYGATVATVSFEHQYSHDVEYGAKLAADYAERLVSCADAMKGIADPRAFMTAVDELIEDVEDFLTDLANGLEPAPERLHAALARVGGAK